ncbi:AMP-binding protein [Seongchinamella sediminis]|uniref:AMP-binding protein n=2 Tax=Seongchinamella sediminis TaxID=2283635 RepID=A0A3L7E2D4_9GAMM|nr:AMP-binding protein [Seongchinamella sediminis]
MGYLDKACARNPDAVWLRDRQGEVFEEWTWTQARDEINAAAAWLEQRYGNNQANVALLSRNRAHWMLADLALMASGNVSIPLFTTLVADTAQYILEFTDARALILGEADNWNAVRQVIPDGVDIITLPGVSIDAAHIPWEQIISEAGTAQPANQPAPADLVSIVFTSGTTGAPKGVMQTHDSLTVPMQRICKYTEVRRNPRFLSYLPLSHIAERQLVMVQSILQNGSVTFNESAATLIRDMTDTRPNFFFGAPRVWEQLQQKVLAQFGSRTALDQALQQDREGTSLAVRQTLGLDQADYMLTAAAPTPPALIAWFEELGLPLMEGFGQTEIMAVSLNTSVSRRIGSIGRVPPDVEMKITEEGELAFKAEGAAIGYYKMPEQSSETFRDGWVHTGDRARIDADGFLYLTGRVKDYFKTIQGKFVAPAPIESAFAANEWTEQLCLLGRGYSKTVIVCVLSEVARELDPAEVTAGLQQHIAGINAEVEKHARIGAVIITREPWTIENTMLTPTLKIRRNEVEERFGTRAAELANQAAVTGTVVVEWDD